MCFGDKPVSRPIVTSQVVTKPVVPTTTVAEVNQAEVLKNKGIAGAVSKHATVFFIAKNLALQLGKDKQFVHAGMVQKELAKLGYASADLGNAAGALFGRKNWRDTGKTVKSERLAAHRRKVTLWEFVGGVDSGVVPAKPVPVVAPVESTRQNTTVGTKVNIRSQFRDKLTGNGQRSFTGTVIEIVDSPRWPLRVEFNGGKRGLLAYNECELA
jgi:hypothetical protein